MSITTSITQQIFNNLSDTSFTISIGEFDKENKEPDYQQTNQSSNVLQGSFTFTPRFLNKDKEFSRQDKIKHSDRVPPPRKNSKDQFTHDNLINMKRRALKRKISIRSRQHLIPLSEQLRYERGEIESGECSASGNVSTPASDLFEPHRVTTGTSLTSIRNIVREEVREQLLSLNGSESFTSKKKGLKTSISKTSLKLRSSTDNLTENPSATIDLFEIEVNPPTSDLNNYEEDEDKSLKTQIDTGESRQISEPLDSDVPEIAPENLFMPDETGLTVSQKSFRSILQMQIEIWQKLLQLKDSTEILEKIALSRRFDSDEVELQSIEREMSSVVTADNMSAKALLNSSLKVVFSQMENEQSGDSPASSYPSNDYVDPSYSCYSKMNEIEHRLSDVEFRMASIHQIIQSVRQQQYQEFKSRQASYLKKHKKSKSSTPSIDKEPEKVGDGVASDHVPPVVKNAIEDKSDPPATNLKLKQNTSLKRLNPYDESYYEWRQYHMNLLHYKKSERTISLNKRPTLNTMKPPILKYFRDVENKYRIRVRKPFFIVTPSRTNSIWNSH